MQLQQLDQLIEEVQAPEEEPANGKIKGAKKKPDRDVEVVQTPSEDVSQSPSRSEFFFSWNCASFRYFSFAH